MVGDVRRNDLMSQHIEVALVYMEMLGVAEARDYLARESIPPEVAERVLLTERKRQPVAVPTPGERAPAPPPVTCRRKNLVHDAIVEAAMKIEKRFGTDRALALLKGEKVAPEVVARIMAQGPRQLRRRPAAS